MRKTIAIPVALQKENLSAAETQELAKYGHQEMSEKEAADCLDNNLKAEQEASLNDIKIKAKKCLAESDMIALRALKSGVQYTLEWQEYDDKLRIIVRTGKGEIPKRPDYPVKGI